MQRPRRSVVWNFFVAATLALLATASVGHAASTVVGWGYNEYGQRTIPSGLGNVVAIATGYSHRLARTAQGGWPAVGGTIRREDYPQHWDHPEEMTSSPVLRFASSLPPRPLESVCSLVSASINTPLRYPTYPSPNPPRTP